MKKLVLLGASGSIGQQTIDVVMHHKDRFQIIGVSIGYNLESLHKILKSLPEITYVSIAEEEKIVELQEQYPDKEFYAKDVGLKKLAALPHYDVLVNAVVGFRGLVPTLTAIEHGKDVALANKESLVAGGPLVKEALSKHQVNLYPIDSEHSAIFQCLQGNDWKEVDRLIITASGGSFRDRTREQLRDITVQEALQHPNWNMGGRITIDSATMMNKGFEVIEAFYLFDIPFDRIDTLIHRESIVHSMVQFQDCSIMAQLGSADMRIPIQYALTYPNRICLHGGKKLDFNTISSLHFQKVSYQRYPLLKLAYEVGKQGGNLGAVMNAADEIAVSLFLQEKISFLDIETSVIAAVEQATFIQDPTLQEIIESDKKARDFVFDMWKGGNA